MKRELFVVMVLFVSSLFAQPKLSRPEQQMRDWLERHREDQVNYLARAVNIPSGTMNLRGVKQTADLFRATLDSLGFKTSWSPMAVVNRSGHLIAERKGKPGTPTILLLGHLDTVFEGPGQGWQRENDSTAKGSGSNDMKGGDVIMIYALKALANAGVLQDANIILVFTVDEERVGEPIVTARKDLVDAAKRAVVALSFEGGSVSMATVARRGASFWHLEVSAQQGHSSGMFRNNGGYGAVYETARIINEFRERLSRVQYLTFNPGIIAGGTDVAMDSIGFHGTVDGKTNIIAPKAIANGDLRFITEAQKDSARSVMREVVAKNLPGTKATITFEDGYPAMSPTEANYKLLAKYSDVSQALGYGTVEPLDPGLRGAGDVSFIAPHIASAIDGLGASGTGAHSPDERVHLNSLPMQTERAAVLIYRLSREKLVRGNVQ
jgi:glutamate carboxypeptidase